MDLTHDLAAMSDSEDAAVIPSTRERQLVSRVLRKLRWDDKPVPEQEEAELAPDSNMVTIQINAA